MTYLQFHLVFILPAIGALLITLALRRRQLGGPAAPLDPWWALALVTAIAFVWTTPWDNYLVYRGVWGYPPGRVLATVGYVPVEEYAFFGLQPVLTGLWFRIVRSFPFAGPQGPRLQGPRWAGVAFWGAVSVVGALLWARGGHTLYLGLILAWAAPVLAGMEYVGGGIIARSQRAFGLAVLPPTVYLWAADRYAIGADIWAIAPETRLGVDPFGLPIEEATFFLITNVLVVSGLLLFSRPGGPEAGPKGPL